jgi:hypothetical protein
MTAEGTVGAPTCFYQYHNLYTCIKAQVCLHCKLLQNAAISFLSVVSLCSDLMAIGNPFQTVAILFNCDSDPIRL